MDVLEDVELLHPYQAEDPVFSAQISIPALPEVPRGPGCAVLTSEQARRTEPSLKH